MVPASALILFSPTVAPASPCRVPREVKEFMAAPAVELGVEAATGRQGEAGTWGEKHSVSDSGPRWGARARAPPSGATARVTVVRFRVVLSCFIP